MSCGCTAPLRADIINRLFGADSRRNDLALELIRIIECQQDTMSPELEAWFRLKFRFSDELVNELLRCVLKQQATMTDELQGVIRAMYFPTSQTMANDFINVVLCGCCPTMCNAPSGGIINTSNNFTVDGWYLQVDASNLVYMESGVITETVPCESGLADFIITSGSVTAAPAVYHNDSWSALIIVDLKNQNIGVDFIITTQTDDWFTNELIGDCQISTDGGITWVSVGTMTNGELLAGSAVSFLTTATSYIYRVIITDTVTGCQYFNPAPDTGSPSYGIYYATIDPQTDPLFIDFGSINGITPLTDYDAARASIITTMAEPYQSTAGRLGGIGIDYSTVDGGGGFQSPIYFQIMTPLGAPPTELAVMLDSLSAPFDTSPQGTSTVIKNYVGTYTYAGGGVNVTAVQGFVIFGSKVRYNEILVTNPAVQQEIELTMAYYQLADPAFSFHVVVNPTNVQVFVTTAIPVEAILFDETGVPSETTVPLIEI